MIFLLFIVLCNQSFSGITTDSIKITTTTYEGRDHFLITTPVAVYYYDRGGGGLSRMVDQDSRDWIAFKKEPWNQYPASAASAYRGIPNLVFGSDDSGAGHPGHDQCTSEQVNDNTIHTVSKSGKWQWTWQFFDDYAQLSIQKVDTAHPYWVLYEGTPGGEFAPGQQYFGTSKEGPDHRKPDYYAGDKIFDHWQWAYFGHREADRVLYLAQLHSDAYRDTFSFLGNSEAGIESEDGMVVFGFGRAEGAQPLMKGSNTFLIGFYEAPVLTKRAHRKFTKRMNKRLRAKQN